MNQARRKDDCKVAPDALGAPELSRGVALSVSIGFLALLVGVPIHQAWTERRDQVPVRFFDLVREPPQLSEFDFHGDSNPLRTYEQELVDASVLRKRFQPRVQELLTGFLNAGNNSVVVAPGGWLFYRPGVDFVSGRRFLAERDALPVVPSHGDDGPLAAIARMHADCEAHGVRLVVMPVREKNQLYLQRLRPGADAVEPESPDFAAFVEQVRALGVEVFDPTPQLEAAARDGLAFLPQETHWTPEAMDRVAAALAARLREQGAYQPQRTWTMRARSIRRLGDLVYNLQLPADQTLFVPDAAQIEVVVAPDGRAFADDRDAEVLLLGDSFTNVYAQADMGWGEHAGLAAHLALHLGAGVDSIAVNAGGASESRRQLASRADPLGGKTVVVWEFVARDLAERNWEVIPLRAKPRAPAQNAGLVVLAELLTRPSLPPPSTLYANARVFLKYRVERVLSGTYAGKELLVELPVLRDRAPLASARFRVGARQKLTLTTRVPAEWEGQPVVDETGEYDLAPLWGEAVAAAP